MARTGRRGRGRGGCESRDVYFVFPFFFFFYCFVLLAAGMEGGEEGERRGVTVTVFVSSAIGVVVLLDHLHYLDGT